MFDWFDLSDVDKTKHIYSKYSIQDFWDWWTDGNDLVMEVRVKDFSKIKSVAQKYNLPYSSSGIYVSSANQLKIVIRDLRDDTTLWFGVNPRKKSYNFGRKSFGGKDVNVHMVNFIFIDVDRKNKGGVASNKELQDIYGFSKQILKVLANNGFNKNYIMICSGHGIQLLIKLDNPIVLPELEYDAKSNMHMVDSEFMNLQNLIRKGIGSDLVKWSKNFDISNFVEIDSSGFNIGRVAALPYSKNFKYDTQRWRGIVEMGKETNEGLTDYLFQRVESASNVKTNRVFKPILKHNYKISSILLEDNKLVRFMLDNDLPYGEINNKLWFQLKCLIRDSGVDINDVNVVKVQKQLEVKYKGQFTLNFPAKRFSFDENIVNKYCINNLYPPLYPLYPKRTYRHDYCFDKFDIKHCDVYKEVMFLEKNTTILEDMDKLKEVLIEEDFDNIDKFAHFHNAVVKKYGREKAEYYRKYLYEKYICFD